MANKNQNIDMFQMKLQKMTTKAGIFESHLMISKYCIEIQRIEFWQFLVYHLKFKMLVGDNSLPIVLSHEHYFYHT